MYALDRDTGHAWWISTEQRPGGVDRAVRRRHRGTCPATFPLWPGRCDRAAQPADLPAPTVTTLSATVVGTGSGEVDRAGQSQRPASGCWVLDVDGGTVVRRDRWPAGTCPTRCWGGPLTVTFSAPPGRRGAASTVDGRGGRAGDGAGHSTAVTGSPACPAIRAAAGGRRGGRDAQLRPGAGGTSRTL